MRTSKLQFFSLVCGLGLLTFPALAHAARIFLLPGGGTFTADSTFDAALMLDTEDEIVNAFDITIFFPPDKLQLVSPSTGKSIAKVWTGPPQFNNRTGEVRFQGGVPGGVNVSQGLIARFTFRVRQVGTAVVKIADESIVLLHDGKGTDVLEQTENGVYSLVLPPPAGPVVGSETHPNQAYWYRPTSAVLNWDGDPGAVGYSYVLNREPIALPDNISEGTNHGVSYTNLANGTHYFHIKALRAGTWGGVTHFAINVDSAPPAEFQIVVAPRARTIVHRPVIFFETTDEHSGIDHYEYKVVSLKPYKNGDYTTPFFIEGESGQVLDLPIGTYDVAVRAYDRAGNFREATQRLEIITALFSIVSGDGIRIRGALTVPWLWVFLIVGAVLAALTYSAFHVQRWHYALSVRLRRKRELPESVQQKLDELQRYREKYGKIVSCLVALLAGVTFLFGGAPPARAQQASFGPPFIDTVSRTISNEEIFYVGGKTPVANADVVLYLQNLRSGETFSYVVVSDATNSWFYRHDSLMPAGRYLIWSQTRIGEELSPPSPQIEISVEPTAIQFGASRLSYETLYFIIALVLLLIAIVLVAYIVYHGHHGRKKRGLLMQEIREAEESVRRGFAVLRRDIERELALIHRAKLTKELSEEERLAEAELVKDLEWAERYIGKEVWDVQKVEMSG
jgi:hypothetical protein